MLFWETNSLDILKKEKSPHGAIIMRLEELCYSTEIQTFNTLGFTWVMFYQFIPIMFFFNLFWVSTHITVTQSQDLWNTSMKSCMRMSSRALMYLMHSWAWWKEGHGDDESPLVNKSWLTLWGPWRKGNGMRIFRCYAVGHRRWEVMVMWGRWHIFMKPRLGWSSDDCSHRHHRKRCVSPFSNDKMKLTFSSVAWKTK